MEHVSFSALRHMLKLLCLSLYLVLSWISHSGLRSTMFHYANMLLLASSFHHAFQIPMIAVPVEVLQKFCELGR